MAKTSKKKETSIKRPQRVQNLENRIKKLGIRKGTIEALTWFRNAATRLGKISQNKIIEGYKPAKVLKQGELYFFRYDPKLKDKLDVYDEYPLIFVIELYNNGFLGLNLHYLPPKLRQVVLIRFAGTLDFSEHKARPINYAISKAILSDKYLKQMIKRYLNKQLLSPLVVIPEEDWDKVVFLPLARFHKKTKHAVWRGLK